MLLSQDVWEVRWVQCIFHLGSPHGKLRNICNAGLYPGVRGREGKKYMSIGVRTSLTFCYEWDGKGRNSILLPILS